MTIEEYKQLQLYSRYDGFYMSVLWIASFVSLMNALSYPPLGLLNELIILLTPFFAFYRLRKFRNEGLGGVISFRRALAYLAKLFLNASLIFGLAQWAYLKFIGGSQLYSLIAPVVKMPEYEQLIRQMGMTSDEYLQQLSNVPPLSFAISCFVVNIFVCAAMSIILAALGNRRQTPAYHPQNNPQA